ncbi:MAG: TetR/AcrR family transcriptional regulator [Ancrocorticia sp.]|nr:TetR/AcrR family transcriptional regulator [Ancrocorticia sp.]MCI1933463.1 TetR/AcrR family transcriptional regulator [Ancrocorticia sp.]MCI2177824.1 TetR/AcrR family transcriptional regulator [Ancrocorticia sp.]MCI2193503.1 TetR/AcrR family transcriptional regulator [Ancrocorticia sp.]MCI2199230.1 TetR/AcrR family transcriptional regulator [Ancrocorticia sp.]
MTRGKSSPAAIQQAALELFADHGVAGTSLQMIATKLGVTKAALYHHYKTKDGIIRAVIAPAMKGFEEMVAAARTLPEASQKQHYLIRALADQAVHNRQLYLVMLQDSSATTLMERDPDYRKIFEEMQMILCGENLGPEAVLRVTMFLMSLVAPVQASRSVDINDATLRQTIIDVGETILRC